MCFLTIIIVITCVFLFQSRSPPHPFITVLISRPDYATHLIQQVNLILLNSINSRYFISTTFIILNLKISKYS